MQICNECVALAGAIIDEYRDKPHELRLPIWEPMSDQEMLELLIPSPMECRTMLAVPEHDRLTVWSGHQMPHRLRRELAELLGWRLDRVRVVVPDTGGAFGSKTAAFPEFVVVAMLAVKLQRPIRWIEDRLESVTAATRGRGHEQRVRLAADADGRLLAYELTFDYDAGAYPQLAVGQPWQTARLATGPYTTPEVYVAFRSVLTNKMVEYPLSRKRPARHGPD